MDRRVARHRLEELILKRVTLSLLSILKTARHQAHERVGLSSKWPRMAAVLVSVRCEDFLRAPVPFRRTFLFFDRNA